MTDTQVFTLIILGLIVYYVVFRKGRFGFWRRVNREPELAYTYFLLNDAWRVEDGLNDDAQPSLKDGSWVGPFYVKLPDSVITVYGRADRYEASQLELDAYLKLQAERDRDT